MFRLVHKIIYKVSCAIRGLYTAFTTDLSFRLDVLLGFLFVAFGYVVRPITEIEMFFLALAWILILITELQNTSIETALDTLHPEHHTNIGNSKDIAAGAVLCSFVFAGLVVGVMVCTRII